jgi:hypothetical protein
MNLVDFVPAVEGSSRFQHHALYSDVNTLRMVIVLSRKGGVF